MRPAALAFLFMLVAVQTVACSPANLLKAQLRASDDNIVGKTFHSLILAPVSDARLAALHPSQLSFETPVHPADLVAASWTTTAALTAKTTTSTRSSTATKPDR